MRNLLCGLGALALLLGGSAPALSQEKGTLELTSVAEVEIEVVNDKGEKEVQRVPAAKVVPGTVVIYTNAFRNAGQAPAENVALTNPVPEHMEYVDGTAFGEGFAIAFSADGGQTYGPPDALTVTDAEGETRPATAADYTHIRWTRSAPLPPGADGQAGFRARLK